MSLKPQTQAILLLTTYFSKPVKGDPKPLSPLEWGRFAAWLREHEIQPETLLFEEPAGILSQWHDRAITLERIQFLLNRSSALGIASEKWERAGLWVLQRSDPHYPTRLKKRLRNASPAILFGCGKQSLLNQGGLAVVGSRDATHDDLTFSAQLGKDAAGQGLSIVSGGARGVDEAAMLSTLEHDGTAVGVLADSLLRAATSAKYRGGLMSNNLVLVSPFNPEAGFDVGNAMSRNKQIYCLADAAVVVATSKGKGGTWNGAIENLKAGWVPLLVKHHVDSASGNAALVQQGAQWFPNNTDRLQDLFAETREEKPSTLAPELVGIQEELPAETTAQSPPNNVVLLDHVVPDQPADELRGVALTTDTTTVQEPRLNLVVKQANVDDRATGGEAPAVGAQPADNDDIVAVGTEVVVGAKNTAALSITSGTGQVAATPVSDKETVLPNTTLSFFELFLQWFEQLTSATPATPDELSDRMKVNKAQINDWLKRAIAEGYANKLSKPTRYHWLPDQVEQPVLFSETDKEQMGDKQHV